MSIINAGCQLGGRYKLIAYGGKRGKVSTAWFKNVITNAGLLHMLDNKLPNAYCTVGSSGHATSPDEITLGQYITSTTGQNRNTETKGYNASGKYGWTRHVYEFEPGVATGNVREVGITYEKSNLFSRSLVRNASGQPAAFTVEADEYLVVVYELRRKWVTPASHTFTYSYEGQSRSVKVSYDLPLYISPNTGASGGLTGIRMTPYFVATTGASGITTKINGITLLREPATLLANGRGGSVVLNYRIPPNQLNTGLIYIRQSKSESDSNQGVEAVPIPKIHFTPALMKTNLTSIVMSFTITITRE